MASEACTGGLGAGRAEERRAGESWEGRGQLRGGNSGVSRSSDRYPALPEENSRARGEVG